MERAAAAAWQAKLSCPPPTSRTSAWAVGYCYPHSGSHTLLLHWNGTRWPRVASPSPGAGGQLTGGSAISRQRLGSRRYVTPADIFRTLILDGTGPAGRRPLARAPEPSTIASTASMA
jgi:hypothetical protein